MARICPHCGNGNADDRNFCTSCGKALGPEPGGVPGPRDPAGVPAAGSPPRNNKKLTVAGIAIAVIVVLVIAALLVTGRGIPGLVPGPGGSPATPTPGITSSIVIETPTAEPSPLPTEQLTTEITTQTTVVTPTATKPVVCPSDRRACGGICVTILTDDENCGDCGVVCDLDRFCQAGRCMPYCIPGEASCSDGCHNLSYDRLNCGTCGNTCPVGLVCNRSTCSPAVTTVIPTYSG